MNAQKVDLVAGDLPAAVSRPEDEGAPIRRAKIICTIGPACDSEDCIRDLMRLGMDVARLNFSHGTHSEHARRIQRLRRAARHLKRTVCILQDLQGPKIRTGRLKHGKPVELNSGARLTITPRDVAGTAALISTDFPALAREVELGARVLLSDGRIELKVLAIHGDDVECEVLNGGTLAEQQGINLPGAAVAMMVRIIVEAEASMAQMAQPPRRREHRQYSIAETICESIAHAAEDLPMGAIAVFTESGNTARLLSKHRPRACIYAFSRNLEVCNRMNALWGVHPIHKKEWNSAEEMVKTAERELLPGGLIRKGDVLGLVAGTQLAEGATNFMRLHTVGESDRPRRKR